MNQPRATCIYEFDAVKTLAAQMVELTKKIDALRAQPTRNVAMVCELCAGNHPSE